MGYTTNFVGSLKFIKELKATELAHLKKVLGIDIREFPDLQCFDVGNKLYYTVDLELTDDFSGIEWSGVEKSCEMVAQVNFVIRYMRSKFPDFELDGIMTAQGEEVDDRWVLSIKDGFAIKTVTPPKGTKIECPHCGKKFYI